MEDWDLETHPPTQASQRTEPMRARWAPKPEQILILESIFNSGMVNPPKHELVKIRELIEKYGPVMDANVYYWFQNRRSRSRRRKRMIQAVQLSQGGPSTSIQHDQGSSASASHSSSSSGVSSPPNGPIYDVGCDDLFSIARQICSSTLITSHTTNAIQHDHSSSNLTLSSFSSAFVSPSHRAIHNVGRDDLFSGTHQMAQPNLIASHGTNAIQHDYGSSTSALPSYSSNVISHFYEANHSIGSNDLFSITHQMGPPAQILGHTTDAIQHDHGSSTYISHSSSSSVISSPPYGAIHDIVGNDLFSITSHMGSLTPFMAQNMNAMQYDHGSCATPMPSFSWNIVSSPYGDIHDIGCNDLFSIAHHMGPPTPVAAQYPGAIQHDHGSHVSTLPSSSLTIGSSHSYGAIHDTGRNDDLFSIAYQMGPPTLVAAQNPGATQHDRGSLVSTSPSSLTIGSSHYHGAIHDANRDDLFSIAYQMRPPTPVATQYPSAIQHDRGSSASAFPSSYSNVVSSPYGAFYDVDQNDPFPSIPHQISPPTPIAVHHPGAIQHGCSSSTFVMPSSSSSVVSFPYYEAIHNIGHNDLFPFTRP